MINSTPFVVGEEVARRHGYVWPPSELVSGAVPPWCQTLDRKSGLTVGHDVGDRLPRDRSERDPEHCMPRPEDKVGDQCAHSDDRQAVGCARPKTAPAFVRVPRGKSVEVGARLGYEPRGLLPA